LTARHLDRTSAAQSNREAAGRSEIRFVNPLQVEDLLAASAEKRLGVELGLQRVSERRIGGSSVPK